MAKAKSWLCILPTILIACAAHVSGQPAISEWQGVVRHADGRPVPGAIVRLARKSKAETKTASDGRFKLPPLPVGKYHLTIESDEHKSEYATPIDLTGLKSCHDQYFRYL